MLNKVMLIGHLGGDPELKDVNGTQLAKFSVATTKKWKDGNETKEKTEWHNISAWGKLAELCSKYLKKGSKVFIEGELNYSKSEKDGETKYFTTIKMDSVQFLSSNGEKSESSATESTATGKAGSVDAKDLPF